MYGAEKFRLYLAGAMPIDGDGEYSEEILIDRINNELVGNLGNFCYRITSFVNKNFSQELKGIDNNEKTINQINEKIAKVKGYYEGFNFNLALSEILSISEIGNKYFQENEPWALIKNDRKKAQEICGLCINIEKNLGILIQPILPQFSENLQQQLNLKNLKWDDIDFKLKNHKIGKEGILIKKIEQEKKEIFPLNLKVGKIISVEDHPNADKLYVLQIDLGNEKRQLVAGLKGYYTKDQLKNKKVIVIANLKYAKLRGIESQGMLLAGDDGKEVGVLTTSSEQGTQAGIENFENSEEQVTYEQFQKLSITSKNNHPYFENKEIKAGSEPIIVEKVKGGARIK